MGQSNSTVLRAGRFIALMLAALSLSLSMAHLLQLPQRMQFDQQLWVEVTIAENADRLFGSVGAFFELGVILAAIALVFLVRRRGAAFYWTLGGAVLLGLAFVSWLIFLVPMNAEFATWLTKPVPADWTRYRNQWEYAQAAIALIKTFGLSCLVVSVLLDAPRKLADNSGFERPHQNSLPATLSSAPSKASSAWLWSVRLMGVIVVTAVLFGLITYLFHSVLVGTILSIAGILGLGSSMDR